MAGRSKRRWARRRRLRRRRNANQRRAFASTPRRFVKYYADKHSQQRQWIATQQRVHTAAKLLELRLTRASMPRAESRAWLEGFALAYARYIPFQSHESITTTSAFIIEAYECVPASATQAIVCGATAAHPALRVERCQAYADFHYTIVYGLPTLYNNAFVRTTFREGPAAFGILRVNEHMATDSNDVAFANTLELWASLEYHDTANALRRHSLRSAVCIDPASKSAAVMCRDGYIISTWWVYDVVASHVVQRRSGTDVGHLAISMLRALVQLHGGVRFGCLPTML